ncbi:MAG TPA: YceH family protein [Accumulibacter sp.]|nr:YceH family protein [Accumulibacter sp.]HMW17666.1 YceH family protein [Accumulibacter sp.]HMX22074.1 YceH family protein [Accumulibacter sp.]HMY05754.1 YceH family protein [Accumulibacter sp.]HNC16568.1 YceH family protein [Accumulibacter sp.]
MLSSHHTAESSHELTPIEARIIGVLIEKEKTTPDVYPLTLNSLSTGCNQKTAREPVVNLTDTEILSALEELRHRLLIIESYGASGRVLRYAQNFGKVYSLPTASVVLLATLILRGPQTVNELRANSERLYRFDDSSSVEAYLEEMAARRSGSLCTKLPKQPGSREHRWTHLLCGKASTSIENDSLASDASLVTIDALAERVRQLETEVAELKQSLQALSGTSSSGFRRP